MNNKLKNFTPIYVINLKDQKDRLDGLKKQFKQYGVKNYTIVEAVDARSADLTTIVDGKLPDLKPAEIGCMASHIKAMKLWLQTSSAEFAIIAEDDLSLETVDYWNWTWDDVVKNIPTDADILQLVMIQNKDVKFHLHKKPKYTSAINLAYAWSTGAYIVRRSYAERLVKEFDVDGKIRFNNNDVPIMVADIALYVLGTAYSMPLFTYTIPEDSINAQHMEFHIQSKDVFLSWWKNQSQNYYPEDLFDPNTNLGRKRIKDLGIAFKIFHVDGETKSLLKRAKLVSDAKSQLLQHFSELDTPTILIDSPDKVSNFYKNNKITIDPSGSRGGWKLGELGVWASNFKAWENFSKSSFQHLVLMEDDIVLKNEFSEKLVGYIQELPDNWDIFSVYIPATAIRPYRIKKAQIDKYSGNICEIYQSHSCLCYVVSKSGAKKLLGLVRNIPVNFPVDTYLFYNENIKAYALKMTSPQICYDFDSKQRLTTIQNNQKLDVTGLV